MYITYIVFSSKLNKYYTGQTVDLTRRLREHNRGKTRFMASGMPWKLIFSKDFNTRAGAIELESRIKKRGAERFLKDNIISAG